MSLKLRFKKWEHRVRGYRRRFFEVCGSDRFSRPARHGLDAKLEAHLPASGFFVEAGAMDGFIASNTYCLERIRGWRGILIEPIPEYFRECVRQRPGSQVVHCALVSPDHAAATVDMVFARSMSFVREAGDDINVAAAEVATPVTGQYSVSVPARTLSSLLSELRAPTIDFLSLDVEGYETEVLRGLDFTLHRPVFILVECLSPEAVTAIQQSLGAHYSLVAALTHRDYLFRAR